MTLYFHTLLYRFYTTGFLFPSASLHEGDAVAPGLSPFMFHTLQFALAFYACTIVFGRLYSGMHSITDCLAGSLLGAVIWAAHWLVDDLIEPWAKSGGFEGEWLTYIKENGRF